MGWDRKKRGAKSGYYYQSIRTPHGVKKAYLGRRTAGHLAAAAVAARKADREAVRAARHPDAEPDRLASDLFTWADALSTTWLVLAGYHHHRGEWRKITHQGGSATTAKKAEQKSKAKRKPREGSREWEKTLHESPVYIRNTIAGLAKRASGGDPQAVEYLYGWLAKHPEMKSTVRELDDLASKAEAAWMERLCGTDPLARRAATEEVAALKGELLGGHDTPLDRILAGVVVVAHLAHQRASRVAAKPADTPGMQGVRERTLSAAQKRLLAAVRGWRLISDMKRKGVRAKGKLKLFAADEDAA